MSDARQPLLTTERTNGSHPGSSLTPDVVHKARFKITDVGESVLKGEADFVTLNGIDTCLGGVHLNGLKSLWRWDERSGRVVAH